MRSTGMTKDKDRVSRATADPRGQRAAFEVLPTCKYRPRSTLRLGERERKHAGEAAEGRGRPSSFSVCSPTCCGHPRPHGVRTGGRRARRPSRVSTPRN